MTHSNLLPLLCHDLPIEVQMHRRFASFYNSILNSKNYLVKVCAELVLNGSPSPVSSSTSLICSIYSVHSRQFIKRSDITALDNDEQLANKANSILDFYCFT